MTARVNSGIKGIEDIGNYLQKCLPEMAEKIPA